jgi:hypothetical protein
LNAPYSLVLAERGALVKHLFVVMEKSPELAQVTTLPSISAYHVQIALFITDMNSSLLYHR